MKPTEDTPMAMIAQNLDGEAVLPQTS